MRAIVLEDQNYTAALSIVRALGALRHTVAVAAPWPTPATLSRWCGEAIVAPWARDRARYRDFVLSLLAAGAYDIGFACTDTVVEAIFDLRTEFPPRPDFLLPPHESLAIALSKLSAPQLAAGLGVPAPRTMAPCSADELEVVAKEWGFPLVVKGETGSGGGHVRYAAHMDDLRRAYQETAASGHIGRPILQEFVPGEVYLTHVLYNHGELVGICSHLKERHFPVTGGVTARGRTVREPQLDEYAARIFSGLRWHGPAKADFVRDARDGVFKLMELDPRISASIDIPQAAGVDMVEMSCRMAAGERIEPRLSYAPGVRVRYVCRDALCVAARPSLVGSFLLDSLNPRIRSDFDWGDMRGNLGLMWRAKWAFESAWAKDQFTATRRGIGVPAHESALRGGLHRAVLMPMLVALRAAVLPYRAARLVRQRTRRRLRGTATRRVGAAK